MIKRAKRILFVENEPVKIGSIVRVLRSKRYDVEVITDLDLAREALTEQWWHLAVVDIRLVDEHNDKDFSGLDLVTRETDPVIPKLILTAYPSVEAAVGALRHYPRELPPAIDFVAKLDPLDEIVSKIVTAVEGRTGINWNLEIEFEGPLTFLGMADWLRRNPPRGETPVQAVEALAGEMADLWGRLFTQQSLITVFPSPQGRSDALLSRVRPYSDLDGALVGGTTVVVKSGWRTDIMQEAKNYERFILPYAGPASTQRLALAQTLNYGALSYSLVGGRLEETERLADFYRAEEAEVVNQALRYLFEQVCAPWYNSLPLRQSTVGLDQAYRQAMKLDSPGKRQRLLDRLTELAEHAIPMGFGAEGAGESISFEFGNDLLLDFQTLETWIYRTNTVFERSLLRPFPESPTHGDLNGNNVLVDRNQQTWLIDFGRTGYGYRLRDFAELESVIAFELRRHESLKTLLHFEEMIFAQSRWDTGLGLLENLEARLNNREQSKALRSIDQLRILAAHWEKDNGDLRRYYLALLFEAVLRLLTDGRDSAAQPPPLWRRAHALLRAALIVRTLSQ